MSAIREEGIGFGGNDDQSDKPTTKEVFEKANSAEFKTPPNPDYILKHGEGKTAIERNDYTLTEKELEKAGEINPQNVNQIREQIHEELRTKDPLYQKIKDEQPLTQTDMNNIVTGLKNKGINACMGSKKEGKPFAGLISEKEVITDPRRLEPAEVRAQGKRFEETRKLIETFKEKTSNYPKYMSYEGSMVLCVLLSMKQVVAVSMNNIPVVDQELIHKLLTDKYSKKLETFQVEFDDNKDFILKFDCKDTTHIKLEMFNTVAHPRSEDLKDATNVPVENDGDKIALAGKIHLNKRNIQRLIGVEPKDKRSDDSEEKQYVPAKQVGRNAYEIRADVLQMAINWALAGDKRTGTYQKFTDDEVITLAKKFYSFVENKRY